MHARPDEFAHERGDAMRNAGQGRRLARAFDERAIEVYAVVDARAGIRPECRGIQHGNEDDPSTDVVELYLARQMLECDGALILIAMIRAECHEATVGLRLWSDEHSQWDEM